MLFSTGPVVGVGDMVQPQSPGPSFQRIGVAALPGVDDFVVDVPQKIIARGSPDSAGIYLFFRQPVVLAPDSIALGGDGRRHQGGQDTG